MRTCARREPTVIPSMSLPGSFCGDRTEDRASYYSYESNSENEEHVNNSDLDSVASSSAELMVMSELCIIQNKLKIQLQRLHVKEEEVRLREQRVEEAETAVKEREQCVEEMEKEIVDVQSMMWEWIREHVQKSPDTTSQRETPSTSQSVSVLRAKEKDNQRLRDSFDVLKRANESLRSQLDTMSARKNKLEKQLTHVQGRLTNLLRMSEQGQLKGTSRAVEPKEDKVERKSVEQKNIRHRKWAATSSQLELAVHLMEWLVQIHPPPLSQLKEEEESVVCQLVPYLPDCLNLVVSMEPALQHSCLQFVLFVIRMIVVTKQQRQTLSSSLRRVGEAIYRPLNQVSTSCDDKARDDTHQQTESLIMSQDLSTRLLSYLVIILTVTQVDCLARVMELLQHDLKKDTGREVFVYHEGPVVILPLMRSDLKILCVYAVNIFLLLSMESAVSHMFMEWCSSEQWMSQCANVFKHHQVMETTVLEKLSIILQRLSKNRANRHLFTMFHLTGLFEDLLCCRVDPDNPFLALNLRSVLINITSNLVSITS